MRHGAVQFVFAKSIQGKDVSPPHVLSQKLVICFNSLTISSLMLSRTCQLIENKINKQNSRQASPGQHSSFTTTENKVNDLDTTVFIRAVNRNYLKNPKSSVQIIRD